MENRHSPAWIGVSLSYVSVLPSCPLSFLPQHLTALPLMTAQVDWLLLEIWVAPVIPLTETGVSWLVESLLLPSLPLDARPQHLAVPSLSLAQVKSEPAASSETPERPDTDTGLVRIVVVPSPKVPFELDPQHFTLPPLIKAQL